MNNILQLKGTFHQRSHAAPKAGRNLPEKSNPISSSSLKNLLMELKSLNDYWVKQNIIEGCLIDIHYVDVIAKSNRVKSFLCTSSSASNNSIVGARFSDGNDKRHIITHYVSKKLLSETIDKSNNCIKLLDNEFGGEIDHKGIKNIIQKKINFSKYGINKTHFCDLIVDTYYIKELRIPNNSMQIGNQSIITIYKAYKDLIGLMKEIGLDIQPDKIINETTMLLYPEQITILSEKAPYLIAMAIEDITKLSYEDIVTEEANVTIANIDDPKNEPIIGIIDTMFDTSVYFSKWVDFKPMIDENIPLDHKDYSHGTAIASIIVDGPSINPHLDDGCGRFRVRHFGVASHGQYSAFSIMKKIKEIVVSNPDIKVWNLSLGSEREINPNFISPEAAILDELQFEHDIIFVVAGTNKNKDELTEQMIGSPADSINSIVVNSVDKDGNPASYSRKGIVLSFFNKPDISSYGGDKKDCIRVCTPLGEQFKTGTSFAAPWITRKIAYLIEVLGLSRETAKALLVDAAEGWNGPGNDPLLAPVLGHGVVPKRIEEIIKSSKDEIKFIINGVSEKWDTYNYTLPVPIYKNKFPFVAKATLCYFPKCSINQGVDYTNTELDIYLGRVKENGIKSINNNVQSVVDGQKHYIYEGNARKLYRKWDNTKHVRELYSDLVRAREVFENGMWGISIKTKERLNKSDGNGIRFGLVITLKEIDCVNRIDDFIRQCELRGWLVTKVEVQNQIDIYNKSQESLDLGV